MEPEKPSGLCKGSIALICITEKRYQHMEVQIAPKAKAQRSKPLILSKVHNPKNVGKSGIAEEFHLRYAVDASGPENYYVNSPERDDRKDQHGNLTNGRALR